MVANKTTKPPTKAKVQSPARVKAEPAKAVAAKAKVAAKAPVKTKLVPKVEAKSPKAGVKPQKAGPAPVAKTVSKIETTTKKSIVSVAAKKVSQEKSTAPAAKAKAVAPQAKPAAAAKPVVQAKAPPASKPAQPVKAAASAAKPAAPAAKTAPQAKAAAVVLPLSKLPINSKPGAAVQKPAAPVGAPVAKPAQPAGAKAAVPAKAPVAQPQPDPKKPAKPANQRHGFRTNEFIVYPSHGVGKIVRIEEQVVAGYSLELFVIHFEQEKMTLRVPTAKLASVGMRKLSESPIVDRAMETLKGRARIKRTMWSRRAQEYEAKINSGDLVAIAEVVRDLYRAETQPEQSYSERQLFEAALDRMSREIAAIENLDDRGATQKVLDVLAKSAKSRKAVEAPEPTVAAGGAERAA